MKKAFCLIIVIFLISSIIGCEKEGWKGKHYKITSYADFLNALDDMKCSVSKIKPIKNEKIQSYFSVEAQNLNVDGNIITVYEFKNFEIAESQAKTISNNGFQIGDDEVKWTDKPHFFQKGNLIVSYIGSDTIILFNLTVILDKSIIG